MILFVTDELPRPGAAGHLALNYAIIDWLRSQGRQVQILLVSTRQPWPIERYGLAPFAGPRVRAVGPYSVATSPLAAARMVARAAVRALPATWAQALRGAKNGADTVLGSFPHPQDIRWCARFIARTRPTAVLIDTIFRAPLLAEPELAGINTVLIAHDVFHRRHLALAAAGYRVLPQNFSRETEAALATRARHIAAIQPDEAAVLRAMCPAQNVFCTPMPAIPCPPPPYTSRIPGRLVFIGSDSLPNLDGLRWFLSDIWPLLHNQGITLDVVGNCGPALRRPPPGVNALGRVEAIAPILHRACLAISPLRTGSGLKIKLLDYARHGLFTIATPPSLQGFAPDPRAPFIQADGAQAFATAIQRFICIPPAPETALAYVTHHYGVTASFAGLSAALAPQDHHASLAV